MCDAVLAAHSAAINLRVREGDRICFSVLATFVTEFDSCYLRLYKFVFGFAVDLTIFDNMDLKFVQWQFLSHCVWYHGDEHVITGILEEFIACIFTVIPKNGHRPRALLIYSSLHNVI